VAEDPNAKANRRPAWRGVAPSGPAVALLLGGHPLKALGRCKIAGQ
jgi:hypothetical protein